MIAYILLDGLLQKQLANAVTEHTENGFERFSKDFRQKVSGIFALQIAAIELNCFVNEVILRRAAVQLVVVLHLAPRRVIQPNGMAAFFLCFYGVHPLRNEKRQKSACSIGTFLAFSENQRQSTFRSRRKAPFLPPKTARTAGRSGRSGAEKRQAFLLPRRLRLLPPPKTARRRFSSVLAAFATFLHGGATSGFLVLGGYALGCVRKAAQIADTGATARKVRSVTAVSPAFAPMPPILAADQW